MTSSAPDAVPQVEPAWPSSGDRPIVFLLDVATSLEEGILRKWIANTCPDGVDLQSVEAIRIPSSRRSKGTQLGPLEPVLATADDPLLSPLRVLWLPAERKGERVASLRDILHFGDPRDPGRLRASFIARFSPDRVQVVAAEPAPASDLRERWRVAAGRDVAETVGLAHFVAKQAALALDRAERKVRGARYKVPRFLHEEILTRPSFLGGLDTLARQEEKPPAAVRRKAERYLKEIAANHSPLMIDIFAQLSRSSSTRGYEGLRVDPEQIEVVRKLAQQHSGAFLPTHKSNLDHRFSNVNLHVSSLA